MYSIAAWGATSKPATPPSKATSVFLDAFGALGSFAALSSGTKSRALAEPKPDDFDDTFTVCFV